MAKSIAQKSVELAEANANLVSQVAGLEALQVEAKAKIESLTAELATAKDAIGKGAADLAAESAKVAEATAKAEQASGELAAMTTKVQELSAKLALTPQLNQPEGQKPVAAGDAIQSDQPRDWPAAVAACGGNYTKARDKYPQVFTAFIELHKNDKKA
jgi:chromosome segregation ATPase